MINHFASQSQTCPLVKIIIFYIEKKLLKVMQSQVELIKTNFKIEAPVRQVQIITY